MATKILYVMILLGSFSAFAKQGMSDEVINNQFVEHLNQHFKLNLKVDENADADDVYEDLKQLEDSQFDKSLLLTPKSLKHISCTAAPCGGCSRGPC